MVIVTPYYLGDENERRSAVVRALVDGEGVRKDRICGDDGIVSTYVGIVTIRWNHEAITDRVATPSQTISGEVYPPNKYKGFLVNCINISIVCFINNPLKMQYAAFKHLPRATLNIP